MGSIGPEQLGRWFDAYAAIMALYARQWLEPTLAEDVVQDVFIRLMCERSAPANVKAWLFRSVRNAAISKLRSRNRRQKHEGRLASERPGWFVRRPDDPIDAAQAETALVELTDEQREVVVLRIWAGMSFREIADTVGRPISTVSSRYRSALSELRKVMEKSHA